MNTPFKMRGFPMHRTASVLKQTVESSTASTGITDPLNEESTTTSSTATDEPVVVDETIKNKNL